MENVHKLASIYPYTYLDIFPIYKTCLRIYDNPHDKCCTIIEWASAMNISIHDSLDLQYEIDCMTGELK